MPTKKLYGGIEAGGTKFVCVVAGGPDQIVDEIRFQDHHACRNIGESHSILSALCCTGTDQCHWGGFFWSSGFESGVAHVWLHYRHTQTWLE